MTRSQGLLLVVLAVLAAGVWGVLLTNLSRDAAASPTPVAASPRPTPTSAPTADPTERATVAPTADPDAPPGDLFQEFGRRLADAGPEAEELSQSLLEAAQAQDDDRTIGAAQAVLDFVDREEAWLADHPPAACYADAHAAAADMLAAYARAADGAIDYATATGLDRLEALAVLIDRAEAAGRRLDDLRGSLEATTCPG